MKNGNRKFFPGTVQHIYQRAINGFLIFYNDIDRIVFYTVATCFARKLNIKMFGMCIMMDHIHMLLFLQSRKQLTQFMIETFSLFARVLNNEYGRKGHFFDKSFGSAPKVTDKKIRSSIAYVANNPVEKGLCLKAEDYRWNFIAYIKSRFPFSTPVNKSRASKFLRISMKEVDRSREENKYLNHNQLRRMFSKLQEQESQQLIDYIIYTYLPDCLSECVSYYKSYEDMIIAINSNTGSEYDIREEFSVESDIKYENLHTALRELKLGNLKSILPSEISNKISIAKILKAHTSASYYQICKFLRIPLKGQ